MAPIFTLPTSHFQSGSRGTRTHNEPSARACFRDRFLIQPDDFRFLSVVAILICMNPTPLDNFIGRHGIYIESGILCQVRVTSTTFDQLRMIATVESASNQICYIRNDRFVREPCPFGHSWEISQEWNFFYLDDDHWDGSIRAGFHILFDKSVVKSFQNEDLSWIDEYF